MRNIPRVKTTEEEKEKVKQEALLIMDDVVKRWLPRLDKRQYPKIFVKLGGSSAAYYILYGQNIEKDIHAIGLRYNVWIHLCLTQKRLLMIHEFIHSLGINHSAKMNYLSADDMVSYLVYLKIYGEDEPYREWRKTIGNMIGDIVDSIPKINKRRIKYFKRSII